MLAVHEIIWGCHILLLFQPLLVIQYFLLPIVSFDANVLKNAVYAHHYFHLMAVVTSVNRSFYLMCH